MSEDPLKDQIITAVKAVTGRVEAIDAVMKEIDEFDGSLGDKGTRCEIEAGMGFVVVDGHGRLVRVRLNPDSLETGDASKLGPRVPDAFGNLGREAGYPTQFNSYSEQVVQKLWRGSQSLSSGVNGLHLVADVWSDAANNLVGGSASVLTKTLSNRGAGGRGLPTTRSPGI